MDTLDGTSWDVLIAGTGIQQSLLALALSRSGKTILHIDKNEYYGGPEAALSLQEVEPWVERVNRADWRSCFSHASVTTTADGDGPAKLSPSRAYSLSLAPTLLYTRSALLAALVSSKVHQHLEFQAVGSWFVYSGADTSTDGGRLVRVPNGREDIFADQTLTLKAKGALMKFLRFVATYEEKPEIWEDKKDTPFPEFLSQQFNLPQPFHDPLLALTLSAAPPEQTATGIALSRIARHLRSIGLFGPGFGAVMPKWGGLSEVAQVGCRAGAVGGAVYVLGKGMASVDVLEDEDVEEIPRRPDQEDMSAEVSEMIGQANYLPTDSDSLTQMEDEIREQSLDELLAAAGYSVASTDEPQQAEASKDEPEQVRESTAESKARRLAVTLDVGERVNVDWVIGSTDELPEGLPATRIGAQTASVVVSRSISIVTGPLSSLFTAAVEGGVTPAAAVVVFPSGSLPGGDAEPTPPVHVMVHSGDTGECPQGQFVLYASVATSQDKGFALLEHAVQALLKTHGQEAEVLWSLQYEQKSQAASTGNGDDASANVLSFAETPLDAAFDDGVLDNVKDAWRRVMDHESDDEFMKFEERDVVGEEDEDDVEDEA